MYYVTYPHNVIDFLDMILEFNDPKLVIGISFDQILESREYP